MPTGVFLPALFAVWCLWAVAAATRCAAEDARRGISEGGPRGVSLVPALPFFPLVSWGAARLVDRVASPWGTVIVGAAHALFAVGLAVSLARDAWRLRAR